MKRQLVLILAGLILASPAYCGTGSYTPGDPDQIQLNVRFQDFPEDDEPDPAAWVPLFRAASRLLFDATERQVEISKVVFYQRCLSTTSEADVIIYNDLDEALASRRLLQLSEPGLGSPNLGIRLSRLHKTVGEIDNKGEFGLVHELGHYVFGLRDEYLGKNGLRTNTAGCASRVQDVAGFDPVTSLMDGGTRKDTNVRTEFCVKSNHRTGQTFQDAKRKIGTRDVVDTDSWTFLVDWIAEHFGATLEPPPPGTLPGPRVSGFDGGPKFEVKTCGGLRLSLGVDSSESMGAFQAAGRLSGTPIGVAKEGSRKLIQLLEEGDTAGVVAVGGQTDTVPMRLMNTENKVRTMSEIPRFQARGTGGWADVLRESFQQIGGGVDPAALTGSQAVVLMSDGTQDVVPTPDDLLFAARRRGVIVHTIGIGKESTELRRVAEKTGGRYRLAKTATEVNASLLSVMADLKSRGTIVAKEGRLEHGEGQPITVHVDSATAKQTVDFLLAWSDPGTELEMTLKGPDGKEVSATVENVVFQELFDGKLKRYRIRQPAPGDWKVILNNPGASARELAFQAQSWTDSVTVIASTVDDVVTVSEPLVLKAEVSTRFPVAGAEVTALIEGPDGAPVTRELFDDGSPEHQDEVADDGAYSNVFEDYVGPGTYTIDLTVDSKGGRTVHPEDANYVSQDVDRFVRTVRFSALVQEGSDQ